MGTREYWKKYVEDNREKIRERNRNWAKTEKGRAAQKRNYDRMMADPERHKRTVEYHREYNRKYSLIVNGKHRRVNKRPRPEECELCSWEHKVLHYHHWDDDKPELGIWVCGRCHTIVGGFERGITDKYLELKSVIG